MAPLHKLEIIRYWAACIRHHFSGPATSQDVVVPAVAITPLTTAYAIRIEHSEYSSRALLHIITCRHGSRNVCNVCYSKQWKYRVQARKFIGNTPVHVHGNKQSTFSLFVMVVVADNVFHCCIEPQNWSKTQ
jgi:hypothetical protein